MYATVITTSTAFKAVTKAIIATAIATATREPTIASAAVRVHRKINKQTDISLLKICYLLWLAFSSTSISQTEQLPVHFLTHSFTTVTPLLCRYIYQRWHHFNQNSSKTPKPFRCRLQMYAVCCVIRVVCMPCGTLIST